MFVGHERDIRKIDIQSDAVSGVVKQSLIGPEQGWDGWVMRMFTVRKDGYTPRHSHAWPHINYVVNGRGVLFLEGQEYQVEKGSVAYVPGNALHQFSNPGEEDLAFLCIVPDEGDK